MKTLKKYLILIITMIALNGHGEIQYLSLGPDVPPLWPTPNVGYWDLNYPLSSIVDSTTNGYTIRLVGAVLSNETYAAGTKVWTTDGINDYVVNCYGNITLPSTFSTGVAETVSIWFRSATTNNDGYSGAFLFGNVSPANINMRSGNGVPDNFYFSDSAANYISPVLWGTNWNNWILSIYSNKLNFFVNGVHIYTNAYTAQNPNRTGPLRIGTCVANADFTEGSFGRVDMYDKPLGVSDAISIYSSNTYPSGPLLTFLPETVQTTNIITDLIGTNNLSSALSTASDPIWTRGINSYLFNGSGYFISTNTTVFDSLGSNWTVSIWVKAVTIGYLSYPISFGSGSSLNIGFRVGGTYGISGGVSNSIAVTYGPSWATSTGKETFNTSDTNQWVHVCYTSSNGSISIYKNGIEQAVTRYFNTTKFVGSTNMVVGMRNDGNWGWPGYIDKPAIYSYSLTSQQVWQVYSENTNAFIGR